MINIRYVTLDIFNLCVIAYGVYQCWKEFRLEQRYFNSTRMLNIVILLTGCVLWIVQVLELTWHLSGGQTLFAGVSTLAILWLGLTLVRHNPFK